MENFNEEEVYLIVDLQLSYNLIQEYAWIGFVKDNEGCRKIFSDNNVIETYTDGYFYKFHGIDSLVGKSFRNHFLPKFQTLFEQYNIKKIYLFGDNKMKKLRKLFKNEISNLEIVNLERLNEHNRKLINAPDASYGEPCKYTHLSKDHLIRCSKQNTEVILHRIKNNLIDNK